MTNCLVTGGCGFIGSHIVDRLVNIGCNVKVIDDESAKENKEFYFNPKARYYKLDISKDDCRHCFGDDGKPIHYVFHLAARSRIQPTIGSPNECFEINLVGTQRVLEWSRLNNVTRVIYSGTSSLYGKQNTIPFTPNMPADCLNPYSMSKWMGEQVCKLYSQLYGLPSITLRYFNVYGPREPIKGQYAPVVGLFKRQVSQKKPMTLVSPGTQRRDFTYIDDVVDANICAMNASIENIPFNIYNVGTGKNYSMKELAELIHPSADISFIPARPAEVKETLADIESTTRDLGWSPKHKLEDRINDY